MSSTCFNPGPVNTWSLSTNQTGIPHAFFPAKAGCCNLVTETVFPTETLHLLFQQIGHENQTLNSYTRDLTRPKNYTGLIGSQVDLSVTKATLLNVGPINGTQQYINCSDAQNLVDDDHKNSMSTKNIIIISIVGAVGAIGGAILGGWLRDATVRAGYSPIKHTRIPI